ncbi:hypothetical protein JWJ90_22840 [Desulfobulbus rhabdoformis]|uniref:hypothetical protein n=1 Tax=Desulfobulbus rhabdoformis TaxID=34032 RepID=UPI0019657490|nr:hypothetical protein [Desulfobulbus rhabdoformis]MBM9617094.1 hypothetical protein [Desulfobulbus rhabdoformis]
MRFVKKSAVSGNGLRGGAEVSRGHSRQDVTTDGSVVAGNKPGIESREDLPCRRAELEEGDVIPHELHIALNPTGRANTMGASWESSSPR